MYQIILYFLISDDLLSMHQMGDILNINNTITQNEKHTDPALKLHEIKSISSQIVSDVF